MELTEHEKKLVEKIKNPYWSRELNSKWQIMRATSLIGFIVMLLVTIGVFSERLFGIDPSLTLYFLWFIIIVTDGIRHRQVSRRDEFIKKLFHRIEELEGKG